MPSVTTATKLVSSILSSHPVWIPLFLSDLQPQRVDGLLPGSGDAADRAGRIPADAPPEGQGRSP